MAAQASAALRARCRRPSYLNKLTKAEDLIDLFPNGTYVGWSGFTGVGYPKKVPTALADHVEKNGLQGRLKYNLFVSASHTLEAREGGRVLMAAPSRSEPRPAPRRRTDGPG